MKRISQEERNLIVNELQQGLKPKDIQSNYGVSNQSMYTIKKENQQIRNNPNKEPEMTLEEIKQAQYDPINIKNIVNKESHKREKQTHAKIPKRLINLAHKKLKKDDKGKLSVAKKSKIIVEKKGVEHCVVADDHKTCFANKNKLFF